MINNDLLPLFIILVGIIFVIYLIFLDYVTKVLNTLDFTRDFNYALLLLSTGIFASILFILFNYSPIKNIKNNFNCRRVDTYNLFNPNLIQAYKFLKTGQIQYTSTQNTQGIILNNFIFSAFPGALIDMKYEGQNIFSVINCTSDTLCLKLRQNNLIYQTLLPNVIVISSYNLSVMTFDVTLGACIVPPGPPIPPNLNIGGSITNSFVPSGTNGSGGSGGGSGGSGGSGGGGSGGGGPI